MPTHDMIFTENGILEKPGKPYTFVNI